MNYDVIGEPLTGKSTLLTQLALDDIKRGYSVVYIDPFGFDVDDLMSHVPKGKIKKTVLFDLSLKKLIKWNPLTETTNVPLLANTITDTLIGAWNIKISPPNIEMMVRSLIYTAVEFDLTLLDCLFLLKEDKGHNSTNRVLKYFWDDYHDKKPRDQDAISNSTFNKLYSLLLDPTLQNLLGQKDSQFSVSETIKDKILFVRLPIAELGSGVVSVLGSLVLAQIFMSAPKRDISKPLKIYVDGMRYFAPSIQAQIVSVLPKYNVHFTGAHSTVDELDNDLFTAMQGSCKTLAFRVSPKDTETLMKGFLPNTEWRLEGLETYWYRELPWYPKKGEQKTKLLPEPRYSDMIERIQKHTIQYYCR